MSRKEPEFKTSSVFPFLGVATAHVEEPESSPVVIEFAPALEAFEEVDAPENDPDNPEYYYVTPSWNSSWLTGAVAILFLFLFVLFILLIPAAPPDIVWKAQREPLGHSHHGSR